MFVVALHFHRAEGIEQWLGESARAGRLSPQETIRASQIEEAISLARARLEQARYQPDSVGIVGATATIDVEDVETGVLGLCPDPTRLFLMSAAGHPGQLLCTSEVTDHARHCENVLVKSLGGHVFDLDVPAIEVFDLQVPGQEIPYLPLRSKYQVRHNLPSRINPYFGMVDEVDRISDFLRRTALITLIGPAGLGKSSLAWRVGLELSTYLPGGVFLHPVTFKSTRESILVEVASFFGAPVEQESGRTDVPFNSLLLLDNCDQSPTESRTAIEEIRMRYPGLRIVATSRSPLNLVGEISYGIRPLGTKFSDDLEHDSIVEAEAGRLFLDRLISIDPGLQVTPRLADEIRSLCRSAQGNPRQTLALALRYSRKGADLFLTPSPGAAAIGIETAEEPESSSRITLPSIEPETVATLTDLLAFTEDWMLPAALDVVRGLTPAVFRHLVEEGILETRLALSGTIRFALSNEIARELVASGYEPSRKALRAHIEHFLLRSEQLRTTLFSDPEGLPQREEIPNIRLAVSRALSGVTPPEIAMRLLLSLDIFIHRKGSTREGAELCRRAIELEGAEQSPLFPRFLNLYASYLIMDAETVASAEPVLQRAREVASLRGDRLTLGLVAANLAVVYHRTQKLEQAEPHFREAICIFEELGEEVRKNASVANLWSLLADMERYDEALEIALPRIERLRREGEWYSFVRDSLNLADLHLRRGELGAALRISLESLERAIQIEDLTSEAGAIEAIGLSLDPKQHHNLCLLAFGAARAIRLKSGTRTSPNRVNLVAQKYQDIADLIGEATAETKLESASALSAEEVQSFFLDYLPLSEVEITH